MTKNNLINITIQLEDSKILYTIKSSIIEMSRNDLRLHRFCTNRNLQAVL